MKGIKIKAADKWFSLCVRERACWACERCGKFYPDGRRMALHCSHFHGRSKYGVRFDPINCEALCFGCHQYLGGHPHIHQMEKIQRIGQKEFDVLLIRANSKNLGKIARSLEKDISDHYRRSYRNMEEKRKNGIIGRLEFDGFKII